MKIKKRLTVKMDGNNAQIQAVSSEPNEQLSAKQSSGVPASVSAAFGSLKKNAQGPTIKTGESVKGPSANTEAMDDGHSEAYKERLKKRVK